MCSSPTTSTGRPRPPRPAAHSRATRGTANRAGGGLVSAPLSGGAFRWARSTSRCGTLAASGSARCPAGRPEVPAMSGWRVMPPPNLAPGLAWPGMPTFAIEDVCPHGRRPNGQQVNAGAAGCQRWWTGGSASRGVPHGEAVALPLAECFRLCCCERHRCAREWTRSQPDPRASRHRGSYWQAVS